MPLQIAPGKLGLNKGKGLGKGGGDKIGAYARRYRKEQNPRTVLGNSACCIQHPLGKASRQAVKGFEHSLQRCLQIAGNRLRSGENVALGAVLKPLKPLTYAAHKLRRLFCKACYRRHAPACQLHKGKGRKTQKSKAQAACCHASAPAVAHHGAYRRFKKGCQSKGHYKRCRPGQQKSYRQSYSSNRRRSVEQQRKAFGRSLLQTSSLPADNYIIFVDSLVPDYTRNDGDGLCI